MGGIILGAMGGIGDAAQQIGQQENHLYDQEQLAQMTSDLEQQKQVALENLRHQNSLDTYQQLQNMQDAPMNRATQAMQSVANTPVPVQAPTIPLSQAGSDDMGNYGDMPWQDGKGLDLQKDPSLLARIQAMPDSDPNKAGMLNQLQRQLAFTQGVADKNVQGQTRTLGPDEVLSNTLEKLKTSDPQAYIALSQLQAKPMIVGKDSTVLGGNGQVLYRDNSSALLELANIASREKIAAANNATQYAVANLRDTDPDIVKVAKALYPEGSQQYHDMLEGYGNSKAGIAGGGRAAVMNGRIISSGNEVTQSIQNIVNLPVGSTSGVLAGYHPGTSLFGATAAALKNEFTPQEAKDYNTMWTGISRNLGTLETAGLATTGSLIQSIDKLAFQPGDTGYDALRKLAEVRQITTAALEPKMHDPTLTADQKGYIQGIISGIQKAVPYTHQDLTNFKKIQSQNPTISFNDYAKAAGLSSSNGNSAPQTPSVKFLGFATAPSAQTNSQ